MAELTEVRNVRQIPGEPVRRWFASDDLDLIVWYTPSGSPDGFQLCYDKRHRERALTWTPQTGYVHARVDDGERSGLDFKRTPILVDDVVFDPDDVGRAFRAASSALPPDLAEFVIAKLRAYPHS